MQLVEKHIISQNHYLFKEADYLCFLSKNLFNYANYMIRQQFFATGEYLNYYSIQKRCQGTPDYIALPAKVAQQVLLRLHESWKSFLSANQDYKNYPEKFQSRPKIPKYKHKKNGRNVVTYTSQSVSRTALNRGLIHLSKTQIVLTTQVKDVCQVRIVPGLTHYQIEIVYEKQETPVKCIKGRMAGIDIGLNNLATVTANQKDFQPLIINGKPLKSINAYFSKKRAELQLLLTTKIKTSHQIRRLTHKRNCKIDNYLHNASRWLINHLVANSIETLVIGKNDQWKTGINLGKRTNQNMGSIPHARFIQMLTYKAKLVGINVVLVTEEYTSKCSFIDQEPLCKQDVYQGRRIHRGLFRSANGTLINADVNGSLNIIRKAFPNAFAEGIQGVVVPPVRVTPYKRVGSGKCHICL